MFGKLDFILEKYEELSLKVSDPDVISNQTVWQKHIKEMGEMEPIVNKYREYKKASEDLEGAKELLAEAGSDEDLKEMAKMEISELEEKIEVFSQELKILLIPKDPNDERNVILEVRAGTGGDEAALFGADLL
ncbi:MAG: PCRF domain-containing protein, partial [Firmicutes bacterium]|nr:PCRF domain-containing protein [Bacillota bacterium]